MKLSDDLKSLIDSSIIDGSISSNERKVLLKRAISEGHDQDEFELHIDSLLFSKNGSFLKKIIYHRKAGSKQVLKKKGIIEELNEYEQVPVKELKIRIWHLILALIIFLIISIIYFIKPIINTTEEYKLNFQHDCIGVDDCLSKYNFEGARAHVNFIKSKTDNMSYGEIGDYNEGWRKIINQESDFWFNDGDYEKALSIIKEEKLKFTSRGTTSLFDEHSYNLAIYKLINSIIDELLIQNKFEDAKKWCFRLPDAMTDGWSRKGSPYEYDEAPKMKDVMMKKIKDYENTLNS